MAEPLHWILLDCTDVANKVSVYAHLVGELTKYMRMKYTAL